MSRKEESATENCSQPSSSKMPPEVLLRPLALREPLSSTDTRLIDTFLDRLPIAAKLAMFLKCRRSIETPSAASIRMPLFANTLEKAWPDGAKGWGLSNAARLPSIEKLRRRAASYDLHP